MWSKLSIQGKIFFLSLLLVVGLVGSVLLFSFIRANRLAEQSLSTALANTRSLYENLEEQRLARLELLGAVVVESPVLKALVTETAATAEYFEDGTVQYDNDFLTTILDSAQVMESHLGSDFMILTDSDGSVLARTDRPASVGQNLAENPMVSWALDGERSSGILREDDRLYHAVSVPMTVGPELLGTVTSAFEIGNELAQSIKQFADCDVIFFAGSDSEWKTAGSTFGQTDDLASWLSEHVMGGEADNVRLTLGGEDYHAVVAPILSSQNETVGAFAALRSRDRELADFRAFQRSVALVGLIGLGFAVLASLLVARGIGRPIKNLVEVTDRIRDGDYSSEVVVETQDEVGTLAESFRSLLGELREKALMEKFLSKSAADMLQRTYSDATQVGAKTPVTVLFSDLKGFVRIQNDEQPGQALKSINHALSRQADMVQRYGGEVDKFVGDRMMAVFKGTEQVWPAVRCGQAIQRLIEDSPDEFASMAPSMGLSCGEAVFGSVGSADRLDYTFLGPVVQVAGRLADEATPGHILMSGDAFEEVKERAPAQSAGELRVSGLNAPVAVFALNSGTMRSGGTSRVSGTTLSGSDDTLAGPPPSQLSLSSLEPGARVGVRYEIRRTLGSGGMGMVFQAHDRELDEPVAIKVLRPEIVSMDPGILERFKIETKVARKITHRNVVRTFDFGEVQGLRFITMEFVRGMTLKQLIRKEGALPTKVALQIAKQACSGLLAAHEQGVVHRDVKPQNIMLTPQSEVKIMDFGIARPKERGEVTQAGMVMGTPDYMSPEQAQGAPDIDHRSDIYSLGVVLFEMFTGNVPFTADTPMRVAMKHIQEQPPMPRTIRPQIPAAVEALIVRCMDKSPGRRYQSLAELQAGLRFASTPGAPDSRLRRS